MCVCVCVCVLSRVQLFATPWTVAHQVSLFVGFPRQEPWSGLPFPTQGNLLNSRVKPCLLCWQVGSLSLEPLEVTPQKPLVVIIA